MQAKVDGSDHLHFKGVTLTVSDHRLLNTVTNWCAMCSLTTNMNLDGHPGAKYLSLSQLLRVDVGHIDRTSVEYLPFLEAGARDKISFWKPLIAIYVT